MNNKLSKRLANIIDALPLKDGMRILEIGCGTGAAAREITSRISNGYVLAIDRSSKAIEQAVKGSEAEINSGMVRFIQAKAEEFELPEEEKPFDLAFAVRVGALDGRHPEIEKNAFRHVTRCLHQTGRLFITRNDVLEEVRLEPFRK